MKIYFVYILKCVDGTYYTGITSNLEKRFLEHKSGEYLDSYTYFRKPVSSAFYAEFKDPNHAFDSEKQIKKWSKVKKEALINGEFEKLPNLAKKKF